jgi:hypothetical protein
VRKPQCFYNPQVWAEDGSIFFSGAYNRGIESLLERYAGYFHALPRLVAIVVESLFPLRAPELFVAAYLGVFIWVSWFLTSKRTNLRFSYLLPTLLVFMALDSEPFLNLTNMQWIAAWLPILVLCASQPTSTTQRIHDLFIILFVGLSGLFSVFFAPLFLFKAWRERTRWSYTLCFLNCTCGIIQAIGFSTLQRAPAVLTPVYSDLIRVVGRPWHSIIFGPLWPMNEELIWLQWALGASTFIALAYLLVVSYRIRNWTAFYLIGASALLWVFVLLSISGNPSILLEGGARYFFLQPILIFTALIGTPILSRRAALLLVSSFTLLVGINVHQYQERPWRNAHWRRQLKRLSAPERKSQKQQSDEPRLYRIKINPPGWFIELQER